MQTIVLTSERDQRSRIRVARYRVLERLRAEAVAVATEAARTEDAVIARRLRREAVIAAHTARSLARELRP